MSDQQKSADDANQPPQLREALRIMSRRGTVVQLTGPTSQDPDVSAGERIITLLTQAFTAGPDSTLTEDTARKWAEALLTLHDRQTLDAARAPAAPTAPTVPDDRTPRCTIHPCSTPLHADALVDPGDGRDPLPACELHAAWLLAALPGATVKASPDARITSGERSALDLSLDLDLVRSMARSLTEEHEKMHDGTWACPLCDPGRIPSAGDTT